MEERLTDVSISSKLLAKDVRITLYREIGSTNAEALTLAREAAPDKPMLLVAESQSAGRGRLGRSFISPLGGLYMTLLTPAPTECDLTALTVLAAVAVARAVEKTTGLDTAVKWVNDVYVGSRKLAGILAQGAVNPDTGKITHVAMGIGINIHGKDFPPEIREIATSIEREGARTDRATLAAAIANEYLALLPTAGSKEIATEYKSRSFLIGCEVRVIKPEREYRAKVIDISESCELILGLEDGSTEYLSTGDVSVRKR